LESDFFIDYRHQEWHGRSNKTQMRARPITEQKFLNFFSRCFYCVYFNRLRLCRCDQSFQWLNWRSYWRIGK
jgi:hypothetical protein